MANVSLKTDFQNGDKLYDHELNNNFRAIKAALEVMNKITWQDDTTGVGVSAYKGNTEAIEARELIDGQLLYNTETGETYIDTYLDDVLTRINTGSGNVVAIQETEPTNDAVKLWIEEDTLDTLDSEIVNEYSENTQLGYSCKYVNNKLKEIYDAETYSTNEIKTNKVWIDGKPVYRKVINFGALPNNGYKEVNHNIENIDNIWIDNSSSYVVDEANDRYTVSDWDWHFYVNISNIQAITESNRTTLSAQIVVEYTKTTD